MDELRRRPCVQPELIHHGDGAARHGSCAQAFSPRSRSEATQMACRPCSRMSRADASRSDCSGRFASLISIGRLTPVITSTLPGDRQRHRQVRRRAAEHVREDQHAGALRRRARSPARSRARVFGVLVPADRDRGESRQVADDRLGRVQQLRGQLPVCTTTTPIMRNQFRVSFTNHDASPGAARSWRLPETSSRPRPPSPIDAGRRCIRWQSSDSSCPPARTAAARTSGTSSDDR